MSKAFLTEIGKLTLKYIIHKRPQVAKTILSKMSNVEDIRYPASKYISEPSQ
jgi:hypothetical protein